MAIETPQALAGYRDAVTELVRSGARFGEIESAIDGIVDLQIDERDALWLLAYSLSDRDERLAALQ